ncbi:hypothetical protein [Sphaerospermopsis aphanizomenoides]|uniref:hypothetical protein n=1 Tax=Sphaerospermopsis aphanizomenoides TaxID=459663 RepID=UPI001F476F0F|nr:hypothetical protein [Sphaerospermopsis aphanizomenoides]
MKKNCENNHFLLTEEAKQKLIDNFTKLYNEKDKNFGNGRLVRNIFEKTIERQANRLVKIQAVNKETLMTITGEDI